ncbi:MAG: hypothetical protein K2Q25_07220 [Mycobacteriaceae bacterium]|nr:hypothetical protein [Mycobacteriaceae bacterium]
MHPWLLLIEPRELGQELWAIFTQASGAPIGHYWTIWAANDTAAQEFLPPHRHATHILAVALRTATTTKTAFFDKSARNLLDICHHA